MENAESQLNNSLVLDSCGYAQDDFREITRASNPVYGFVTLLVCTIGGIADGLCVWLLMRNDMAAVRINRLLKWLGLTDICVKLELIGVAICRYLVLPVTLDFAYYWAMGLMIHVYFTQLMHTIAVCLTLAVAIWRCRATRYSDKIRDHGTERRWCSRAGFVSCVLALILNAPTFVVFKIEIKNGTEGIAYYGDAKFKAKWSFRTHILVHGLFMKILPCFILTFLSVRLILALKSTNRNRKIILENSSSALTMLMRQKKTDRRTQHVTNTLLVVFVIFLFMEIPQGILDFMGGVQGWCFFKVHYDLFGELIDILALLSGTINFVLYCSMFQQFRQAFRHLQPPLARWLPPLARWLPPATSHSDSHLQDVAMSSRPRRCRAALETFQLEEEHCV